ncbi:MAG: MCE family protein [Propionibacteriales bacterium]|nr:MCE family protein [Propionibacteriales bacterium]
MRPPIEVPEPPRVSARPRRRLSGNGLKVGVFTIVTAMLIALLATLIGNISFAPSRTYFALFTDATGVFKGDRVRISGVEVGTVQGVSLVEADEGRRLARLELSVRDDVPVMADARLQLRYENIVGQRYLAVMETADGGRSMPEGGTFPVSQTRPALNLTQLFNGFQPLFRALDPKRLNEFSFQLVRTLQGESGTVRDLLRNVAELTDTLADKDRVIDGVVRDLGTVLETVGNRDEQLSGLIVQFRDLMTGLAQDRDAIDTALPTLNDLLGTTTGLLREARPSLRDDVSAVQSITEQLHDSRDTLSESLDRLPGRQREVARIGSYGSWFNTVACGFEVRLQLLDGFVDLGGAAPMENDTETACAGGQP